MLLARHCKFSKSSTIGLHRSLSRSFSAELLSNKDLWQTSSFVNGEWLSISENTFDVINPGNGSIAAKVSAHSVYETEQAIQASNDAWQKWKHTTGKERSRILRKLYDLININKEDLAIIMTLESGKPIAEARGEILYANSFVELYAEEAKRIAGDVISPTFKDKRTMAIKQSIGPCALITPWNFPSAMITRKLAPALAAGCTAVIKPAEQTPLSALALMKLCELAGIPKGVVNCISTSRDDVMKVGETLCHSPHIRKLSFTGSTNVGKWLYKECSTTMKKISMELGGNAPFIVFEDADLNVAVNALMGAKFRNTGQVCISSNRIFVHESIYDEFTTLLKQKVEKLRQGDGFSKSTTIGPMIDDKSLAKVIAHVEDCRELGAEIVIGGQVREDLNAQGATFYEPTVIKGATPSMRPYYEEIFGPIAPLFSFRTEEEVISMANDTPFGLAGYFCSKDIGRIFRVAEALEVGMVGVNEGSISNDQTPFGGIKQSGIGREGGSYGIEEYLEQKLICIGGI